MLMTHIYPVYLLFLIILLSNLSQSLPDFYHCQSEQLVSTRNDAYEWIFSNIEMLGRWNQMGKKWAATEDARQSCQQQKSCPAIGSMRVVVPLLYGNDTVHTDRVIDVGAGCICWSLHIVPSAFTTQILFSLSLFSLVPNSKSSMGGFQLQHLHLMSPHSSFQGDRKVSCSSFGSQGGWQTLSLHNIMQQKRGSKLAIKK